MAEKIQPTNKEETLTNLKRVACDGPDDGRHPRVYLDIDESGTVVCPYCSHVFRFDARVTPSA